MTEQQCLQFDAPPEDPVAAYVASALTGLDADQDAIVRLVSETIADYCAQNGILVHQPAIHTHPVDHESLKSDEVHDTDFRKVLESDVIVAIGDFPSWGAGKELAWAERLRTPILMFIREDRSVSRLIVGTPADIEIVTWHQVADIRDACSTYFTKRRHQLEAQRRLRVGRRRLWSPALQSICRAYDKLDESGRISIAATARLSDRRVREVISSPLNLAHASLDEALALVNALRLPSSTLLPTGSPPQLPSLWWITWPVSAPVRCLVWMAVSRASGARSVRKERDGCQPGTRRLKASITNAAYTKPLRVRTQVRSASHSRSGAGTAKSRSTRSAGGCWLSSPVAVRARRTPSMPRRPMRRPRGAAGDGDVLDLVEVLPHLDGPLDAVVLRLHPGDQLAQHLVASVSR